jgi:hypothetical protein
MYWPEPALAQVYRLAEVVAAVYLSAVGVAALSAQEYP